MTARPSRTPAVQGGHVQSNSIDDPPGLTATGQQAWSLA
jgi:hypothetical protein